MSENITDKKRYYVDFYDMIDGWGGFGFFPERLFDDPGEAIKLCDKLNAELDQSNKDCGEHFGVINQEIGREIYCGMDKQYKMKLVEGLKSVISGEIKDGDIDWLGLEEYWRKEYEKDYIKK